MQSRTLRFAARLLAALGCAASAVALDAALVAAPEGSAGRLSIHGQNWPYAIASTFTAPGERVPLGVSGDVAGWTVDASGGRVVEQAPDRWVWEAPASPGLFHIDVSDAAKNRRMRVNAFVETPAGAVIRGRLNGYTIGSYPARAVKNSVEYAAPRGFVEVNARNEDAALSPHFRLRDFLCKQPGGYPKYIVLREALVLKLERVITALQARGYGGDGLRLLSGYRTPSYNRAIGNVAYSMHLWGGAADVIIDTDFNGDGRIDRDDAVFLSRVVDALDEREDGEQAPGGLGVYGATTAHGPFVHVDVRPAHARWSH